MSQMSLGDVLMLSIAAAVVMSIGACSKAPASEPQIEFKPAIMQCKNDGKNERCYDKELHVYCWRPVSSSADLPFSCVPGQWTYDEKDEPYEG